MLTEAPKDQVISDRKNLGIDLNWDNENLEEVFRKLKDAIRIRFQSQENSESSKYTLNNDWIRLKCYVYWYAEGNSLNSLFFSTSSCIEKNKTERPIVFNFQNIVLCARFEDIQSRFKRIKI